MKDSAALCLLPAVLLFSSCGKHAGHDGHDHHDHASSGAAAGASFREGRGLTLPPETRLALGLETAPVEERELTPTLALAPQVFERAGRALASVNAPAAGVKLVESDPRIVRIHLRASTGLAELVVSVDPDKPVGAFVPVVLEGKTVGPVAAVPRSALLRSAEGTFVYVVNGGAYLRTPVTAGVETDGFIEITDGLYSGDEVVTRPVEQLWLTELRFTKGGGHSH